MPEACTSHQLHQSAPSPRRVAAAIAIFFPYGFYLLWKHPTLGKKPLWWVGGIAYVFFAMFILGERTPDTKAMQRIAEATLPNVYGDYEMKWGKNFLAGKEPSKYGWGGTAKLANGSSLFVSFFPKGNDFVWLSSPSDGGIYASVFSDTRYWNSKGESIDRAEEFWSLAGHPLEQIREEAMDAARTHNENAERRRQRNSDRFMEIYKEERAKASRSGR
jgi:hypothetical protein